jgi:F-type H+-transporting ATPase subunit b
MFQEPEFWVAVAFFIFMGIAWKAGAFSAITKGLDTRAARIKAELDDARALREEAQRVLVDYQKRREAAEAEAEGIVKAAREEAERLAAEAQAKLADFVARRTKMAEQKIAQAEAQATAEVRAAAADAAVRASEDILRKQVASGAGNTLLEQGLKDIRAKLN